MLSFSHGRLMCTKNAGGMALSYANHGVDAFLLKKKRQKIRGVK